MVCLSYLKLQAGKGGNVPVHTNHAIRHDDLAGRVVASEVKVWHRSTSELEQERVLQ